jgi:hypothetical protein
MAESVSAGYSPLSTQASLPTVMLSMLTAPSADPAAVVVPSCGDGPAHGTAPARRDRQRAAPRRVARCWASRARRITSKVCACGQAVVVRSRTSRTRSV